MSHATLPKAQLQAHGPATVVSGDVQATVTLTTEPVFASTIALLPAHGVSLAVQVPESTTVVVRNGKPVVQGTAITTEDAQAAAPVARQAMQTLITYPPTPRRARGLRPCAIPVLRDRLRPAGELSDPWERPGLRAATFVSDPMSGSGWNQRSSGQPIMEFNADGVLSNCTSSMLHPYLRPVSVAVTGAAPLAPDNISGGGSTAVYTIGHDAHAPAGQPRLAVAHLQPRRERPGASATDGQRAVHDLQLRRCGLAHAKLSDCGALRRSATHAGSRRLERS